MKYQRAKKPCTYPGCRTLVADGGRRCEKHTQGAWSKAAPQQRLSGRALQEAREALFRRRPLCAQCEREGRVAAAKWRDHIVPVAEGGTDDPGNIQGLCAPCHEAKTEAERRRGIVRKC